MKISRHFVFSLLAITYMADIKQLHAQEVTSPIGYRRNGTFDGASGATFTKITGIPSPFTNDPNYKGQIILSDYSAYATGDRALALGSTTGMGIIPISPELCPSTNSPPYSVCMGTQTYFINAPGNDSIALGTKAFSEKDSSIAIGRDSAANVTNSVAIGSHSIAGFPNLGNFTINGGLIAATDAAGKTLSVGAPGFERQIQNVAAGVIDENSTNAVNGSQLYVVGAKVLQNTNEIAKNTTDIANVGTTVATQGVAIGQQATQIAKNTTDIANVGTTVATGLGGGSTYNPATGVSAPSYKINGMTYSDVGSALTAINSSSGYAGLNESLNNLGITTMSGFSNTYGMINNNQREARQGIAMAASLAQAPMPSAPGKTSWKFNNAIYKNAAATSLSIAHRLPTRVPVALTAGVAIGLRSSAIVTGGLEGEF
jgi:hypothetical protein